LWIDPDIFRNSLKLFDFPGYSGVLKLLCDPRLNWALKTDIPFDQLSITQEKPKTNKSYKIGLPRPSLVLANTCSIDFLFLLCGKVLAKYGVFQADFVQIINPFFGTKSDWNTPYFAVSFLLFQFSWIN
jgi:hypothetical protein